MYLQQLRRLKLAYPHRQVALIVHMHSEIYMSRP